MSRATGRAFRSTAFDFMCPVPPEEPLIAQPADFSDIVFYEPVPGLVLGRGPGTKSFKEVSDYRGFIFLSPCPV